MKARSEAAASPVPGAYSAAKLEPGQPPASESRDTPLILSFSAISLNLGINFISDHSRGHRFLTNPRPVILLNSHYGSNLWIEFGMRKIFGKEKIRLQQQVAELQRANQNRENQLQREREETRQREEVQERIAQINLEQQRLALEASYEQKVLDEKMRKDREEKEAKRQAKVREDKRMAKLRMTSPDSLRRLRQLMRRKYELDLAIWSDRKCRLPDRPYVEADMEEADAVLHEILTVVSSWGDNSDNQWQKHEWELASDVYNRLQEEGKRWWHNNPPYEED